MKTSDIVSGNEIFIDESLWTYMNETMEKDDIKQLISDAIEEFSLPMPMREISLQDADEDFMALKDVEPNLVQGEWFARYEYKYPLTDLYFPTSTVGNKVSDYFHQESRWHCDSKNSPSPFRCWTIERFRLTLLNALWSWKVTKVDSSILRNMIALRKYIASQFRPATAKMVYDHFDARNVLDFSSGWGDRLAGACASKNVASYVGIDPNTRLVRGYEEQKARYGYSTKVDMINACAEDVDFGERTFDTIFTSPPYYCIEYYDKDNPMQSYKRYKGFDSWNKNFLQLTIGKVWDRLETGGNLIINISDVYADHRHNVICDPMNDHIATLNNSEYAGCYGYQMRKRPNAGGLKGKTGVFCEPIWVWRKI